MSWSQVKKSCQDVRYHSFWRSANARNVGFETHNGGQFALSTQLRYQITLLYSPTDAAPQFLKKPNPFNPLNTKSD